jgi:hypothetical protein
MIATQLPMAGNSADSHHDRLEDTQHLRRQIDALQTRLKRYPEKSKQLSWDTELLRRKTEDFGPAQTISAKDADWKQTVDNMTIGPAGICISDVRTVQAIEYIAAFAASRQLTMTYGNKTFLLEPRDPNTLA